MFTIGNNELDKYPKIKEQIVCHICGKLHNVKYGRIVNEDGTEEESEFLGYIHCPQNNAEYLVAIDGKDITDTFRKE